MDRSVLTEVRRLTAAEDVALLTARERAAGPASGGGGPLPTPEVGALLRFLAASCDARHAVEIGSAAGVTGLWLMAGMPARAVLTSIEADPHRHEQAATAYVEGSVADRVRLVLGDPLTVLPRLSDGGYELVLLQDTPANHLAELDHAVRLLQPGGVLVVRDLFASDDAADARAAFVQRLADHPRLTTTVLPLDDGLALATSRRD